MDVTFWCNLGPVPARWRRGVCCPGQYDIMTPIVCGKVFGIRRHSAFVKRQCWICCVLVLAVCLIAALAAYAVLSE